MPLFRDATAADHTAFSRLFPELGVDDPTPSAAAWAAEIMPTTLVCEVGGNVCGYIFFQPLDGVGYVRNVVVDAACRGQGIGRQMMMLVAQRFANKGIKSWHLNVNPSNVAAVRLYTGLGMRRAYASTALHLPWAAAAALPVADDVVAQTIEPNDDAEVETALKLIRGQLANARGAVAGFCRRCTSLRRKVLSGWRCSTPRFPGPSRFASARPTGPAHFCTLCAPMPCLSIRFSISWWMTTRPLTCQLCAAGATVKINFDHYEGDLPAADQMTRAQ